MKWFVFGLALASTSSAFATTLCAGGVWITNSMAPQPYYRTATVIINPDIDGLRKRSDSSEVIINMGGDTLDYKGQVDITGGKSQNVPYSSSNGNFSFQLKVISDTSVQLQGVFINSQSVPGSRVLQATLTCQTEDLTPPQPDPSAGLPNY